MGKIRLPFIESDNVAFLPILLTSNINYWSLIKCTEYQTCGPGWPSTWRAWVTEHLKLLNLKHLINVIDMSSSFDSQFGL